MPPVTFSIETQLSCSVAAAWAHAASVRGVRAELAPVLSMTFPPGVETLDGQSVPLGRRLCRSWLLLFGILPVEFDDLTIMELEPERRFLERSQMASLRVWCHERLVTDVGGRARVKDRLAAEPRSGVPPELVALLVQALFRHRHRRLRALFGPAETLESTD